MKSADLNALDTAVVDDHIYALVKCGERLSLSVFDKDLNFVDEIWSVEGQKGFILKIDKDRALLGIDDRLYLVEDGEAEAVLTASVLGNLFWHLTEVDGKLFVVHEYGEAPTAIYVSSDLRNWERAGTNLDIDRHSRHFHYVAYDPYRKWLIATLGDGCLTRATISEDLGSSWKPLYRGPWQFVPTLVLREKLAFGMDSGIARGGIGVYDVDKHRWSFIFLKWRGKDVKFAQMCDLKLLNNCLYIAGLGTPQAIVVSLDMKTWYLAYVEGFDERFNMHVSMSEGKDFVACSTGKSLLLLTKDELKILPQISDPVIVNYRACIERMRGLGFNLKHMLLY